MVGALLLWTGSAYATMPGLNGKIAFSSYGEIYTVNPDGSGLTHVVREDEDAKQEWYPNWSPDGTQLAVGGEILVDGHWSGENLHLFNPDGSGFERLRTPNQHFSGDPAWSPDGTRIAYSTDLHGYQTIYTTAPTGGPVTPLVAIPGEDAGAPAWSPDGSRIAFVRSVGPYDETELFTMRADGTDVQQLLERPGRDASPSWSPDGRTIVFAGTLPREGDGVSWWYPGGDIYAVPATGGEAVRLTFTGEDFSPAWSPDGTTIVFQSNRHMPAGLSGPDLYLMGADGGDQRRLTHIGCLQCGPDWQRIAPPRPSAPGPASPTLGAADGAAGEAAPAQRFAVLAIDLHAFRWTKSARKVHLCFSAVRAERVRLTVARLRGRRPPVQMLRTSVRANAGLRCLRLARVIRKPLRPGRYRLTLYSTSGPARASVTLQVLTDRTAGR